MKNPFLKLLKWYGSYGRDLPWRHTKDSYHILVSEMMLQQTQVGRVIDFYTSWLDRFPNWKSLADASNADVLNAWSGLGYNRRALMLRDIAKQVIENGVPGSREEWQKLKGIGPYASAAIAIFSQNEPVLPIDTNIRRVLGRIFLGATYPDPKQDADIEAIAQPLLSKTKSYEDVPQALFDVATDICTKVPRCDACPMQDICKARKQFECGNYEVPKRMIKKAKEKKHPGKKYPDRIYRGRILSEVKKRENGIKIADIGDKIDGAFKKERDEKWIKSMLDRLEKDGMITKKRSKIYLSEL